MKEMTREDKLYTMRMQELKMVADKLGIKINTKAAKSIAIEKILEAEHMNAATDEEIEKQEQEVEELKAAEEETKQQYAEIEQAAKDFANAPATESKQPKQVKRGELITYNGKSQNICTWAKELGKSPNTLYGRLYKLGWPVEKAFTK